MTTTEGFAAGLVGIVLDGRYRLDAVLGEGGMGSVFRAQHLEMDRKVAIKLLKPHLTTDAGALQRFAREARATLKVDSPHAVKVQDFGVTPQNDYYMVLEYLDGRTVQRELEIDGPFAPARVLHIAQQALHALGAAHRSGLVHRDIKPDNILLMRVDDDPDYTKLLDFGVAKLMEGAPTSDRSRFALTQAGMVFGTPEFMSPEQACGHSLDGRSDLYSLGATMFAMLTGCALFEGKTAIELLTHHARTPPPHLAALVPELEQYPRLDDVLQKCLSKHRDQRPKTAEDMVALLADLELYVSRGGAAARTNKGLRSSPEATSLASSSFVKALPPELVDPGETLLPAQLVAAAADAVASAAVTLPRPPSPPSPSSSGAVAALGETGLSPALQSRRGLYLTVGALIVVAMIGVTIAIAMKKSGSGTTAAPADAAVIGAIASDGGVAPLDAPVPFDASVPEDAAGPRAIDAGTGGTHVQPPRVNPAAEHLRAAEDALRQNNRLRQLAEADLALKADPRNVRAKYLLADALIKGGDLDRGCAYLRGLGRNPLATARATAANCPP
ncbi:MAG: protein kinase [Myxococcales bacterium]|nr:protein kinase [Myxococcales bacterium]